MIGHLSVALIVSLTAGSTSVLPETTGANERRAANVPLTVVRRRWTDDDDLIAYYLSTYDDDRLLIRRDEIARRLGMSLASLRMRERNFRHLADGRNGLSHTARRSRRVYALVKDEGEPMLRDRVLQIIARR